MFSYVCLIFKNKITSLLVYSQDHTRTSINGYTEVEWYVFSGLNLTHRFEGMQQIHFGRLR